MPLFSKECPRATIAMVLAFITYSIVFPFKIYMEREGWIWTYPGRNMAMEHMWVVTYFTWGLFLLWGARKPLSFLPLIDLTIVVNIIHGTMMLFDALSYPNHLNHVRFGGDVSGTYITPIILILGHPKYFYLPIFRNRTSTV
jgi:hypothetical protein